MGIRAITTAPTCKYSFGSPTVSAGSGGIYLSRDRTTFYGTALGSASNYSKLTYSTDGGGTWTDIRDFHSTYSGCQIEGMIELANGEVLICLALASASVPAGRIYKSSGWASNRATATMTNKSGSLLTQGVSRNYSLNNYCQGSNGVILVAEEGPQTESLAAMGLTLVNVGSGYTYATITAPSSGGTGENIQAYISGGTIARVAVINGGSGHTGGPYSFNIVGDGTGADWTYTTTGGAVKGSQTNKARRLIMSEDYGETWSIIYDIFTTPSYKYRVGCHLHAAVYDEDWDRIWLQIGDNTGEGPQISGYPTKTQVIYSDDRGATWESLDASEFLDGSSIEAQWTSMKVTKYALILGQDALRKPFGFVIYPKIGFRTLGEMYFAGGIDAPNTAVSEMQYSAFSETDQYPSFLLYHHYSSQSIPTVLISYNYGFTTYEFWRETDLATRPLITGGGILSMFGPDTSGRLIGGYNGYGKLTGTLVTNF